MDEIVVKLNEVFDAQLQNVKEHSPITFSPFGAILATIVITYAARFIGVFFAIITGNGVGFASPRDKAYPANSFTTRAIAAHLNSWEGLIMLVAAVFMGTVANLEKEMFENLVTLYVLSRAVYVIVYVFAFTEVLSLVRSAVFTVGLACIVRIMLLSCEAKYGYLFTLKDM